MKEKRTDPFLIKQAPSLMFSVEAIDESKSSIGIQIDYALSIYLDLYLQPDGRAGARPYSYEHSDRGSRFAGATYRQGQRK